MNQNFLPVHFGLQSLFDSIIENSQKGQKLPFLKMPIFGHFKPLTMDESKNNKNPKWTGTKFWLAGYIIGPKIISKMTKKLLPFRTLIECPHYMEPITAMVMLHWKFLNVRNNLMVNWVKIWKHCLLKIFDLWISHLITEDFF